MKTQHVSVLLVWCHLNVERSNTDTLFLAKVSVVGSQLAAMLAFALASMSTNLANS